MSLARIAYDRLMRVSVALLVLAASCRFDPSGGTGGADDVPDGDAAIVDGAVATDAASLDARPIDARAIDAGGDCPMSYGVVVLGHRYALRSGPSTFSQAADDCGDDVPGRTHLATFELAGLMDGVITAVNPGNQATPFVGAKCRGGGNCNDRLSWSWITQVPVDPAAWHDGTPDGGGAEAVTAVERRSGTWKLISAAETATLPYVCECDP